ncbi:hypothetical protein BCR39DRAFT_590556 [Naematelia encephala]|uniref:Uncharacterized protein n=1 Tax=Naematelia encephala TaxID=71784 RepID=A0A1Y2APU8_9TREE|nr:hypothetical protein BCR39DRAFT_590556 [Naematelia encephala]
MSAFSSDTTTVTPTFEQIAQGTLLLLTSQRNLLPDYTIPHDKLLRSANRNSLRQLAKSHVPSYSEYHSMKSERGLPITRESDYGKDEIPGMADSLAETMLDAIEISSRLAAFPGSLTEKVNKYIASDVQFESGHKSEENRQDGISTVTKSELDDDRSQMAGSLRDAIEIFTMVGSLDDGHGRTPWHRVHRLIARAVPTYNSYIEEGHESSAADALTEGHESSAAGALTESEYHDRRERKIGVIEAAFWSVVGITDDERWQESVTNAKERVNRTNRSSTLPGRSKKTTNWMASVSASTKSQCQPHGDATEFTMPGAWMPEWSSCFHNQTEAVLKSIQV